MTNNIFLKINRAIFLYSSLERAVFITLHEGIHTTSANQALPSTKDLPNGHNSEVDANIKAYGYFINWKRGVL